MRRALCGVMAGMALTLVGCSAGTTEGTAPTVSTEQTGAQAAAQARLDEQERLAVSPQGLAYVAAFRAAYPPLADGRDDRYIGRDGVRICDDLAAEGLDVVMRRVPLRVERNGVVPDEAQTRAIIALARQHFCPGAAPAG